MRIAISAGVVLLALLVGARTQWPAVSNAAVRTAEDRAFSAAVLGETSLDASSGELIDAAVTRGDISSEQGLLYGVYLACDPSRLPAELRGSDTGRGSPAILSEADVDWSALSPDIQGALRAVLAAQASADAGSPCGEEIRRLAGQPDIWWGAAFQKAPDRAARTAGLR